MSPPILPGLEAEPRIKVPFKPRMHVVMPVSKIKEIIAKGVDYITQVRAYRGTEVLRCGTEVRYGTEVRCSTEVLRCG